jgi:hypothetical protein
MCDKLEALDKYLEVMGTNNWHELAYVFDSDKPIAPHLSCQRWLQMSLKTSEGE